MQAATSIDLYEYWTRLRGGETEPLRRDFDPAYLRHSLPALFMLECGGENDAVFRLAGTAICDAFGCELRGLSFENLWRREDRQGMASLLARVPRECDPLLLKADGPQRTGQPMPLEILLVPLRSQTGACDRILGCMTALPSAYRHWDSPIGSLELKQAAAVRMAANGMPFTLPLGDPRAAAPQRLMRRIGHALQSILVPRPRQRAPFP